MIACLSSKINLTVLSTFVPRHISLATNLTVPSTFMSRHIPLSYRYYGALHLRVTPYLLGYQYCGALHLCYTTARVLSCDKVEKEYYLFVFSRNYEFYKPKGGYFVCFAVLGWLDVFTINEHKQIRIESLHYCYKEKGTGIFA